MVQLSLRFTHNPTPCPGRLTTTMGSFNPGSWLECDRRQSLSGSPCSGTSSTGRASLYSAPWAPLLPHSASSPVSTPDFWLTLANGRHYGHKRAKGKWDPRVLIPPRPPTGITTGWPHVLLYLCFFSPQSPGRPRVATSSGALYCPCGFLMLSWFLVKGPLIKFFSNYPLGLWITLTIQFLSSPWFTITEPENGTSCFKNSDFTLCQRCSDRGRMVSGHQNHETALCSGVMAKSHDYDFLNVGTA